MTTIIQLLMTFISIFNECIKNDDFVKIIKSKSHTAKVTGSSGAVRSITWKPTNFYATGEAGKTR